MNPEEAFHPFLAEKQREGWIQSWSWHPLRREGLDPTFSKTHKDVEGNFVQLEVESPTGFRTGVDLEFYEPGRPIFQNKDWLERRFKIPSATIRSLSATDLMEQWCYREASFKALYPYNRGVLLSDFEMREILKLSFSRDEEEFMFSLSGQWQESWFLALSRRNS